MKSVTAALALMLICTSTDAADLTILAEAEFSPRDIYAPQDGVADVFVGGNPEVYKYLFIKAGTEDRACAEFPLDQLPACTAVTAQLRFFIRTLDDGLEPPDPIEVKAYAGNGLPDLEDFDPPDGRVIAVFDGPLEDPINTNGCPAAYQEWTIDVTSALHLAMVNQNDYLGFVFRDTVGVSPSHRFDLYSNTWNCQPPSNCCSESFISLQVDFGVPGDANHDEAIDLLDLPYLADCLAGPGNALGAGCEPLDIICDGDVDLDDFRWYQQQFGQ